MYSSRASNLLYCSYLTVHASYLQYQYRPPPCVLFQYYIVT